MQSRFPNIPALVCTALIAVAGVAAAAPKGSMQNVDLTKGSSQEPTELRSLKNA